MHHLQLYFSIVNATREHGEEREDKKCWIIPIVFEKETQALATENSPRDNLDSKSSARQLIESEKKSKKKKQKEEKNLWPKVSRLGRWRERAVFSSFNLARRSFTVQFELAHRVSLSLDYIMNAENVCTNISLLRLLVVVSSSLGRFYSESSRDH